MKIALGCDSAGFALKDRLINVIKGLGYECADYGTNSGESCDYPDFAAAVAEAVASKACERGILICGTGIGMSICANKVKGIRAAVCNDEFSAKATSAHNASNILCIGARVIDGQTAENITELWLTTPFEGGRHSRRLDKITDIENKYFK
jgi:ribose 5-phosphate isomerase B